MEHIETREFVDFEEFHFNAREIESYRLLVNGLLDLNHRKGLVEGFIYKEDEKKYHLYFYRGKKAFYTISAHIERKGEPKKEFSENLKNYISYLAKEG
jgi:hypothetical protein